MTTLYPLTFEPIFKTAIWGGTRLRPYLGHAASPEATGEAWMLSDVDGNLSRIANGPLAGRTLRDLLAEDPSRVLGDAKLANGRFPLLLKFLDARTELSVQVHPTDEQAAAKRPGQLGKTEAWVVLDANPATSLLYAGFRPGVTAEGFRRAMSQGTTPETLHRFSPKTCDCVFLEAGTVHAIGRDLMLFEVQQTSDITYRLYDWDRVDAKTGKPRELHIDDGLACTNFALGPCNPVTPARDGDRDRLVACRYFSLHHRFATEHFPIGAVGRCTILVVLDADPGTELEWADEVMQLCTGSVVLCPAEVAQCRIRPAGPVRVLEIGLP